MPSQPEKSVRVNVGNSSDGVVRGMMMASMLPMGAVVVSSLIAGVIGLGTGYYWRYNIVKSRQVEIEAVVIDNELLTKDYEDLKLVNESALVTSLAEIGLKESEIKSLTEKNKGLLAKGVQVVTKYIPGKTVYIPRAECGSDYIGTDYAKKVNAEIQKAVNNRARTKQ